MRWYKDNVVELKMLKFDRQHENGADTSGLAFTDAISCEDVLGWQLFDLGDLQCDEAIQQGQH